MAVLGILSGCQSLWDLERFAIRHHAVLTEALGIEIRRPPSDSSFRRVFHQVDVAALSAAIRDWTIAQIPCGAGYLDQLVCEGKPFQANHPVLTSLRTTPQALLQLVRDRWSMEGWHWIRDTQLHEDAHRYRGSGAG